MILIDVFLYRNDYVFKFKIFINVFMVACRF